MLSRLFWCAVSPIALFPHAALAQGSDAVVGLEVEQITAIRTSDSDVSLARLTLLPEIDWAIDEAWQANAQLRLEVADDGTGLGSLENYSPASRPLIDADNARLEIDELTLAFRSGGTAVTLGKQTIVWGTLDGIRVTDRFDAIRFRDFILTDTRPERISRWGVRLQHETGTWEFDGAFVLDSTVNQLGQDGDAFFPQATRFRGGIRAGVEAPIQVADRGRLLDDATYGARATKQFNNGTISFIGISGPDTEAVIVPPQSTVDEAVLLDFPRRELFGASLDLSLGSIVFRLEGAHIPNQPINTLSDTPLLSGPTLSSLDRPRTIIGLGADLIAPGDVFLNVQLAADHIDAGESVLVRPETDVIASLTAQKPFRRDTMTAVLEFAGTFTDGDGVVRPRLEYDVTDQFEVAIGGDLIFGPREGQFGQYRNQTRIWVRFKLNL